MSLFFNKATLEKKNHNQQQRHYCCDNYCYNK